MHTVDCRKVTCGVITVGAHGVANANNETFTPVTVGSLGTSAHAGRDADGRRPDGRRRRPDAPGTGDARRRAPPRSAAGPATLEVDRGSAAAGNVLAFTATGLPAGRPGLGGLRRRRGRAPARSWPAPTASLAGVITLPADTGPGTHELRLYGVERRRRR